MSPDKATRLNPLFNYSPEEMSPQKERCGVTDRFIPTRKLMKKDSLWSEGDEDWAQENQPQEKEPETGGLCDLYRQYVMCESPKKKP